MSDLAWVALVSVGVIVYAILFAIDRITSRLDLIANLLKERKQ